MYKYEYHEEASSEENKTQFFADASNFTENETNSTSIGKAELTGIVKAIRVSSLDIFLFFLIITLIFDEIQQVKFEINIYVHLIYTFID